ncbi:heme-binding protein [Spiribacter sp. 2438]|uniref:GlcG/HbpS family heme-binding protein n=1 Tax=Spiribacter sp. 2438 TaxID=2666185 RepID=UPI0012AF200A|nr:heme-binding protein [Spiribacter sp. 2438]QGM21994.1 heme-binding protein [Spiribacter sp. 2438]
MPKSDVFPLSCPLPLDSARAIIQAAREKGREQGFMPLTVVVLDAGGHRIAMEREDGCGIVREEVATGKAWGALGIGIGSRTIAGRNQGREAFLAGVAVASDGRFVPVPGGVLVIENGQAIGAVGISGDTSDADEMCAVAGIEAAGYQAGIDTPD